jgi:hypothetical protein
VVILILEDVLDYVSRTEFCSSFREQTKLKLKKYCEPTILSIDKKVGKLTHMDYEKKKHCSKEYCIIYFIITLKSKGKIRLEFKISRFCAFAYTPT